MEVLRSISLYCEAKGLRFLVIGGHALNAYGVSRQTGDIDIMVCKEDRTAWLELFDKLSYVSIQNSENFARFRPPELAAWPIDLMYVDVETFNKVYKDAQLHDYGLGAVHIASARHLLLLKLHALKNYQPEREPKDYGDVLALLRTGRVNIQDWELKELCVKYANSALFDRIKKDLHL